MAEPNLADAMRDPRISYRAKGVLAYALLTSPWPESVNLEVLHAASDRDGRTAIQTALHELRSAGYRIVHRPGNKQGASVEWTLDPAAAYMPPEKRGEARGDG